MSPVGIHINALFDMFRLRGVDTRQEQFYALVNQAGRLSEDKDRIYYFESDVQEASSSEVSDTKCETSFPTLEENVASFPAARIGLDALVKKFRSRVNTRGEEFIAMVMKIGRLREDSVVIPRPGV